jgi:hypothetical protein
MTSAAVIIAIMAATETGNSQSAEPDFFTADVAVSQMHVGANGQRLPGTAPSATYRIEHRAGAHAFTRVAMVEFEGIKAESVAGSVTVDNPLLAVRMELDPKDGLRLFNRRGDRLPEVTAADRRFFGIANPTPATTPPHSRVMSERAQVSNLVVAAGRQAERRTDIEREFGRPVERLRGLDRYIASRRGNIDELLVDPVAALPVELNTVRGGVLASRVQIAHEPKGNGAFVRRWFRAERALADGGRRVVTTIEVTNVRIGAGGVQ